MHKSVSLIEVTKVKTRDGVTRVLYNVAGPNEIFDEGVIWANMFGGGFLTLDPPGETVCWWNALTDLTVKPGSFPDTMTKRGKPRFSRMGTAALRTWLSRNTDEGDYSQSTRIEMTAACNDAWEQGEF